MGILNVNLVCTKVDSEKHLSRPNPSLKLLACCILQAQLNAYDIPVEPSPDHRSLDAEAIRPYLTL
jgi:hypothetical protein